MNTEDVHNIQHEKNKQRLVIYKQLSQKCFKKIEQCVQNGVPHCMYQIPAFQIGFPLYNMTQYITYLMKVLQHKGFLVKFIKPNLLFISWGFN